MAVSFIMKAFLKLFDGFNPVLLAQLNPPYVKRAFEENIKQGTKLISPECALPFSVPSDNLIALTQTAHSIQPQ